MAASEGAHGDASDDHLPLLASAANVAEPPGEVRRVHRCWKGSGGWPLPVSRCGTAARLALVGAIGCALLLLTLGLSLFSAPPGGGLWRAVGVDETAVEGAVVDLVGGACQNTPGWTNGWTGCAYSEVGKDPKLCAPRPNSTWPDTAGFTCKYYHDKGLCRDGEYKAFAMGPGLNSPEKNCCVCRGFRVAAECNRDTLGGCRWTGFCNGWRGPTDCTDGKCMCKPGYCADSAGTCFQSSRAAAVREKRDHKAGAQVGQVKQCSAKTSGTCFLSGCESWRGATTCEMFSCLCKPGHCPDALGTCYKDLGTIKAAVKAVNAQQRKFPGAQVKTGLAVSGGGSRALSSALGVFRGLRDLGVLSGIDAISSVSGGSWASSILMFADMDLDALLGPATDPSQLTLAALDQAPCPLGKVVMARTNDIALELKSGGVPFGMLWVATVATAFLSPFKLDSFEAVMAPSQEAVKRIKAANPQYESIPFQVPQPGRAKQIIMGSTVEAPDAYKAAADNAVYFQASPDFIGVPFYPENKPVRYDSANIGDPPMENVLLGGGFLESFAFGASAPTHRRGQMGGETVEMKAPTRPFSLARAVGMSSAAFGGQMSNLPGLGAQTNPQVDMWPVSSLQHPRPQKALRYMIGDGGNLENTGVIALLQRKPKRVVSIVSGAEGLKDTVDYCSMAGYVGTGSEMTSQIPNLYGFGDTASTMEFHTHNQVFDSKQYPPLLCELYKLKSSGKPLVVKQSLQVQKNTWWGLEGGNWVEMVFVVLDRSAGFEALLPADTQEAVNGPDLSSGLHDAPHLKTCFENSADLTMYLARQINYIAALQEYAVHQNADLFRGVFG